MTECVCQFIPQFLFMGIHSVSDPLISTDFTSPLPPTLWTRMRLKYLFPFKVNLTPPFFWHGTLMNTQQIVVSSRDNASSVLSNFDEARLRKVEVARWWITPPWRVLALVIWRAEVGGCDSDCR